MLWACAAILTRRRHAVRAIGDSRGMGLNHPSFLVEGLWAEVCSLVDYADNIE